MPRRAKLSATDFGQAQRPDFSISEPEAKHHDAATQYFEEAARHHRQATKLYQSGRPEEASQHAHLAYAYYLYAGAACRGGRQSSLAGLVTAIKVPERERVENR